MGTSDFKAKFHEKEKSKEQEIANCREYYYIRNMFFILTCFGLYGYFCYVDSFLFNFMPVFRCDDCRYIQIHLRSQIVYLWELNTNQLMFIIVNWVELAYLYYIYRKLKARRQTQLNIFIEVYFAAILWMFFSVFYFGCVIFSQYSKNDKDGKDDESLQTTLRIMGTVGIQLRNLLTFWTTTLFTLHHAYFRSDI